MHYTPNPFADSITYSTIKELISGELAAIRIKNFCPIEVSEKISRKLITHPDVGRLPHALMKPA